MANFSINQVRQLYVAKSLKSTTAGLTTAGTYYLIAPACTVISSGSSFSYTSGDGFITYTGVDTLKFHAAVSYSINLYRKISPNNSTDIIGTQLRVNGFNLTGSTYLNTRLANTTGQWDAFAIHKVITLSTGNTVGLYISDLTSNNRVASFYNLNLVLVGDMDMGMAM